MPLPQERWLAYGIVVDDDNDGRADYRYGIDNAGVDGSARMWRTDISTGKTRAYVNTLEDPRVMDGAFPESADFESAGHIFPVPPGEQFRFYVWASAIVDDQIVATDYAPDAGWID
jgi:hypothetical protein